MAYNTFSPIVTNGLIFHTDPSNTKSFTSISNPLYDIVDGSRSGTFNGVSLVGSNFGFDGVSDYIDFGVVNFIPGAPSNPDITINIFLYLDSSYQESYANIMDFDHGNGGFTIQQYFPNPYEEFYLAYWNGSGYEFLFMTLPMDRYFSLDIVKSGTNLKGYIDGVLSYETTAGSDVMSVNGFNFRVGRNVTFGRYMNGNISSIKMYNRALSSNEVIQNYNSIKSRFLI